MIKMHNIYPCNWKIVGLSMYIWLRKDVSPTFCDHILCYAHAMLNKYGTTMNLGLMHYGKSLKISDIDFQKNFPNIFPRFSEVVTDREIFIS